MVMTSLQEHIDRILEEDYHQTVETASTVQLYQAVSRAAMSRLAGSRPSLAAGKRVGYFSAEFLMGRMIYANLLNMGLLKETDALLASRGVDIGVFEEIEDAALGNGGLGRLAACFLDSAATQGIPLDGYGIRYRYGLFKQTFENGFQQESADDWTRFGDPWSVRREEEAVQVSFRGETVKAVPYDMPVIGYGGQMVNNLRLWQAEPLKPFDFQLFNAQKYAAAVRERDNAETISSVLYPNDDTDRGKRLRLKQQYFFSSASLQDILRSYRKTGEDIACLADRVAIQLNDTHPTVSIPELIRLLCEQEGMPFGQAMETARAVFAYTNHTIMPEALEKWSASLFRFVLPKVYPYILRIDEALTKELTAAGIEGEAQRAYRIVDGDIIHMARLAIFATHSTNGVARLHTEILKRDALPEWYALYPERFNNKTNGITQRRWLALANPELAALVTEAVGPEWITDLERLKGLEAYRGDAGFLDRFAAVKMEKKAQLAAFVERQEGIRVDPAFLFDVQVKRLHEYKRQLLNALSILDTYYGLKDGRITGFTPTLYLFGAKAAPGYFRAKGIIKYIHEVGRLINSDPAVADKMRVVFVHNYNVSYAEKIIPAADVSEQISTAGTEASGTSNMKFMLNGAVTLGTYDGANVEIVEQAGEDNNYIFGARVEEIEKLRDSYEPRALFEREPRIRRVVESLIDGTFSDGGTGMFRELYSALLDGASWHRPDNYFLLHDFLPYCDARLQANRDYADRRAFTRKCLLNTANAGVFSSDRTIREYARDIWQMTGQNKDNRRG